MRFLTPFVVAIAASSVGFPTIGETSWEDVIRAVDEKSKMYFEYALGLDPTAYPGTALNGIGHDRHVCAIVGRMLGFREEIKEAETFQDPPLTPDANPMELTQHSVFLQSWIAAAKRAVAMTENQKVSLWNLECLGEHGIPRKAQIEVPGVVGDFSRLGDTLVVYGNIDAGFFERFVGALDENQGVQEVALGSAGGSVSDAILSGLEIRKRGLSTTLQGPCYSACPLVFVGGETRMIWSGPGPYLGFHQLYTSKGAVPQSDPVYERVAVYLNAMGVDQETVIPWMLSAAPSDIFEPELESLCSSGVATWVQRVCGW